MKNVNVGDKFLYDKKEYVVAYIDHNDVIVCNPAMLTGTYIFSVAFNREFFEINCELLPKLEVGKTYTYESFRGRYCGTVYGDDRHYFRDDIASKVYTLTEDQIEYCTLSTPPPEALKVLSEIPNTGYSLIGAFNDLDASMIKANFQYVAAIKKYRPGSVNMPCDHVRATYDSGWSKYDYCTKCDHKFTENGK